MATSMKAYLHPKAKPTSKAWYAYDVTFEGETVLTDSRDPEHELARVLLARGITGKVTMHDGNTGKGRTMFDIEKAAKLTVSEENRDGLRVRKYRENPDSRAHSPEEPLVLPTLPTSSDEDAA